MWTLSKERDPPMNRVCVCVCDSCRSSSEPCPLPHSLGGALRQMAAHLMLKEPVLQGLVPRVTPSPFKQQLILLEGRRRVSKD